MKKITRVNQIINSSVIKPGSKIYCAGNASTPQVLLKQMAQNPAIVDVEMLSTLLLGDNKELFSKETCERITHRVIFNGHLSRNAVNEGWAKYQLLHLSDIPRQLENHIKPNIVFLTVAGPDNGGNYSLGTTVEAIPAAIRSVKEQGGLVIAERNAKMPFVLGTTVSERTISYLLDTSYDLPVSPVDEPDSRAKRIAHIIAELFIDDGSTLQFGIGEVPEAVTGAIIEKGVKDLGIRTELFADAMRTLIEKGIVTNKYTNARFSLSSIFLSENQEGYHWLHYNSSVQSRPADRTNSILNIAKEPKMVAINSAIGVDLHGNIWADSLHAGRVYSGVGGQADFLRGAYLSEGGIPIIAMKSTTDKNLSKIVIRCPEGITTTAIAADPVVIVTEHGAFIPHGLSITEHATGIAHLADPDTKEKLLKHIYDSKNFHTRSKSFSMDTPKGFIPADKVI
jgi:4-hydroxybutyrate CoA-transferase